MIYHSKVLANTISTIAVKALPRVFRMGIKLG